MDQEELDTSELERLKLQKAGTLHWVHWLVLALSLAITFGAWSWSNKQVEVQRQSQFDREAARVTELVQERMLKYEDALWAGVAMIDTLDGDVSNSQWAQFATGIHIEDKYPGINGIGIIRALTLDQVPGYLQEQRVERPNFRIHPHHGGVEFLPITHIEPVASNSPAVGLDLAHEVNRFTAAKKARDTGHAQITGPIVLVQDASHTPGFLFYAPFYAHLEQPHRERKQEEFLGMVYAPFVFEKLMEGTLANEKRHVGIRISDRDEVLFDEHQPGIKDFDPEPLFTQRSDVWMYGRKWSFDIRSAHSFRGAQDATLATTIMVGGLIIDALLLGIFFVITRTNRMALEYADRATHALRAKAQELKSSNLDLERFAYVASHDLQEPLRMVSSFAGLLGDEYGDKFDEQGNTWLEFMVDGAKRMQALVAGLLEFSRVGQTDEGTSVIDVNTVFENTKLDLGAAIEESGATITRDELPQVFGKPQQFQMVLQNLLSNALKSRRPDVEPAIHVGTIRSGKYHHFFVRDNGIGIEPQYIERIFVIFQRLHTREAFAGTGIGLAVSKKIIDGRGGNLWVEPTPGGGTTFLFSIPIDQESCSSLISSKLQLQQQEASI